MQTRILSPCSDLFSGLSLRDVSQSEKNKKQFNHVIKLQEPKYKHGVARIMCANSEKDQPSTPNPAQSPSSGWKKWMAGIVLSVATPSLGHRYGPLLMLKSKIDKALKTAESVTEAVEELAEEADKFIKQVEEKLPENSNLKQALDSMEVLAEEAEKEAKKAENLIHQVEVIEKEVETALLKSATGQKTGAKN